MQKPRYAPSGGGVCDVWFPEHRTIIDAVVPGVPLAAYVRG